MAQFVTEWNDRALIAQISGRVLNGMDKACRFAAEQARSKAPRRTGTLAGEIDYTVEAERNEIVGRVGVKKGDAFYGYFIERGTRRKAARPFLRPAVFDNASQILRMIAGG